MTQHDTIKLFGMTHQMVERDLDQVEKKLQIDLQRQNRSQAVFDEEYHPQFEAAIRKDAAEMAVYYQLFYCLERTIRELVHEKLEAEKGVNWWQECVPDEVRENAKKNMKQETEAGVTPRSNEEIDYTTFGELGEIVRRNWEPFSDTFNSQKAFSKVMNSLNVLRGPIAHCCQLAPDEVTRLQITVRDWFRLME